MNRDEARAIYKEIKSLYPLFNRDNDKQVAILWLDRLEHGEYEQTKRKLLNYSMESTYPPTLADVIVKKHKHRDDNMAALIKEAEESVKREKADPEVAARRERKLQEMRRKLGAYYGD